MTIIRSLILTLLFALAPAMTRAAENQALFAPFQTLLDRHLIEQSLPGGGLETAFDYQQALQQTDTRTRLREQADTLADFNPDTLDGREQTMAFWINAYNFFMVQQILTEKPQGELVSSVWDYGGRVNPFQDNIFERSLFTIGGKDYSLDEIEKETLLGDAFADRGWKDARVHFAVNCASVGCPPLRQRIYTADNLENLLAENTRLALNTPRHLAVDGNTLRLTSLFDWYREDFVEQAGSVRAFIHQWADPQVVTATSRTDTIEYIDYDWALNRPDNFPAIQP